MFAFLGPLLSGLFGGGGGAALLGGLASGAMGLLAANKQAKSAAAAQRAEQEAIRAAEAKSQGAYRDALRGGASGQGSGSFRLTGPAAPFSPSLKTLTGQ